MKTIFLILLLSLNVVWAGNRDVAVLWDSSEVKDASHTYSFVFQRFEVILNHYGYKLEYHDINKDKFSSSDVDPKKYYGLITWFIDDISRNLDEVRKTYRVWFKSKKKVLTLGELGLYYNDKGSGYDIQLINKILKKVNIKFEDHSYDTPLGLVLEKLSPNKVIEFERSYKNEVPKVKVFSSLSSKNKAHVKVKSLIDKKVSLPIIEGDNFFMVGRGFEVFYNSAQDYYQWRINPFYLVEWLVGSSINVFPDTTTINGRRIFYAHIDGDAFINVSDVDRESISGKIILDHIIDKYNFPLTVSFVVAELDSEYLGKRDFVELAKKIASRENVELASHTYHHPLSWDRKPSEREINAYLDDPSKYDGGPIMAYPPKDKILDYKREIHRSLDYINKTIAPKGKESKFLLWSGSCKPPLEALAQASENGLLNMNGGDSRFDSDFPSYAHLFPLYREVSGKIQVHSSNSNENTYTNNWIGPFSGQLKLIETFENTDKPIRVKPMNLYYHFYSGEKLASLNTLKKIYNFVESQNAFPLFSSDYAQLVEDYVGYSINIKKNKSVEILNHKSLKTFRIDEQGVYPNYALSKNVIGHKKINNSLYIFLGPSESSILKTSTKVPNSIFLKESNMKFSEFSLDQKKLSIKGIASSQKAELELHVGERRIVKDDKNFTFKVVGNSIKIEFLKSEIDLTLRFQ